MTTNGHGGSASPVFPDPARAAGAPASIPPGGAGDAALAEAKRAFRRIALARRAAAPAEARAAAAVAVRGVFAAALPVMRGTAVSGYVAIRDELDVLPLLADLHAAGAVCALPAVTARGAALSFRAWVPGAPLQPGAFGVAEPAPAAAPVRPALLLVPLLAFDRGGRRLGYGAGFYDRTLARLRAEDGGAETVAVGIGYAAQEWPEVPAGPLDERLDWIVTEREAIRVAAPVEARAGAGLPSEGA